MRTLRAEPFWSFHDNKQHVQKTSKATLVRHGPGHFVESYLDLARKVAELQFRNPHLVLLFRGQGKDYRNSRSQNTMLKPSILRNRKESGRPIDSRSVEANYLKLAKAEQLLLEEYKREKFAGIKKLQQRQILRWAILQHYGVCDTPLLDASQSLRIAASIASHDAKSAAFVFVLGIPNIGGAVTVCAEAGLQVIRLASVCPPEAVRPHIQEGYLLGEYPDLANAHQRTCYKDWENDFSQRLVAKFTFKPSVFWKKALSFPKVPKSATYPSTKQDKLRALTERIKKKLPKS